MKNIFYYVAIFISILIVFSCQESKNNSNELDKNANLSKTIQIQDSWIRPAAQGMNTAAFFYIVNNTEELDTLYDVSSELALLTQVHETYTMEDDKMGMRHIKFIEIPQHSKIEFKPHGLHVMLMKLKNDLKIGDTGDLILHFKKAGDIKFSAVVKDMMQPVN